MRSQAGAQRYGVAVGQVYTKEKQTGELSKGDSGQRTKAVQDMLIRAGYLDESSGKNKGRDGLLGPKTEAGLKKYQKENGLKETGKFDAATSAKLGPSLKDGPVSADAVTAKRQTQAGVQHAGPDASGRLPGDPAYGADPAPKAGSHPPKGAHPIPGKGTYAFEEDEQPSHSPTGGKLKDYFPDGSTLYDDGSLYNPKTGQFVAPPKKAAKR